MLRDRVEQTSTTTGTGTYSLTGTVAQRQGFVAAGLAAQNVYYLAIDAANGGWEIGIGLISDLATDTLSRATILGSSNGGLAVNWGAGTRNIMCVAAAELFGPMGGRLKYGVAGGSANAITVATPVPLRALTGGAMVAWRATAANTGAATLNVDGTGAQGLRDYQGTALPANAILNGQLCFAILNDSTSLWHLINPAPPAASDTVAGVIEIAVQSEMEAATDVLRAVPPGRQRLHPSHFKNSGRFNGTGVVAIDRDDGWSTITDGGVGNYTINLDTAFSDTTYGAVFGSDSGIGAGQAFQGVNITAINVGSLQIATINNTPAAADYEYVTSGMVGDF